MSLVVFAKGRSPFMDNDVLLVASEDRMMISGGAFLAEMKSYDKVRRYDELDLTTGVAGTNRGVNLLHHMIRSESYREFFMDYEDEDEFPILFAECMTEFFEGEGRGCDFLVAHKGRIYAFDEVFSYFEVDNHHAIGSGCIVAMGALDAFAVKDYITVQSMSSVMEIAHRRDFGVGEGYHVDAYEFQQ